MVEITEAEFHDEIGLVLANMISVGREDVGMATVKVYLKLVDEVIELDFILLEAFDGDEDTIDVGDCQDDISSLAFAQMTQHLQLVLGLFIIFDL